MLQEVFLPCGVEGYRLVEGDLALVDGADGSCGDVQADAVGDEVGEGGLGWIFGDGVEGDGWGVAGVVDVGDCGGGPGVRRGDRGGRGGRRIFGDGRGRGGWRVRRGGCEGVPCRRGGGCVCVGACRRRVACAWGGGRVWRL